MSLSQFHEDDVIEIECKKLLACMSNFHCTWDWLMDEPEARTGWMYEKLVESNKEMKDKFEEQASQTKLKGAM